jgi:hypothetical protein
VCGSTPRLQCLDVTAVDEAVSVRYPNGRQITALDPSMDGSLHDAKLARGVAHAVEV